MRTRRVVGGIIIAIALTACGENTQFRASPADGRGGNARYFDADSIERFDVHVALHRKGAEAGKRHGDRDLGTFCRTTAPTTTTTQP